MLLLAGLARAAPLRIAFWNVDLTRAGPGMLLRDLERGRDAHIKAVVAMIVRLSPDILVLDGFDADYRNLALGRLALLVRRQGADYPYLYSRMPNSGLATGFDLDGDGRTRGAGDAQGFGAFPGQRGMAILSRLPILSGKVRDYSALLWRALPGAKMPRWRDGTPFPSAVARTVQRLASRVFWDVPVRMPDGRALHLLVSHASPPGFDGPENRNGLRNRDEIRFWSLFLAGKIGRTRPWPAARPFVIAADLNADPRGGQEGVDALRRLLDNALLNDPWSATSGGGGTAPVTVMWPDGALPRGMRVDYLLPSRALALKGAGIVWPPPRGVDEAALPRHRMIWVEVR